LNFFEKHPNTILAHIIGLYTIDFKEVRQRFSIILMENISKCEKREIKRVYDMKGSTYSRKVIKEREVDKEEIWDKKTLKDQDFVLNNEKIVLDYDFS